MRKCRFESKHSTVKFILQVQSLFNWQFHLSMILVKIHPFQQHSFQNWISCLISICQMFCFEGIVNPWITSMCSIFGILAMYLQGENERRWLQCSWDKELPCWQSDWMGRSVTHSYSPVRLQVGSQVAAVSPTPTLLSDCRWSGSRSATHFYSPVWLQVVAVSLICRYSCSRRVTHSYSPVFWLQVVRLSGSHRVTHSYSPVWLQVVR